MAGGAGDDEELSTMKIEELIIKNLLQHADSWRSPEALEAINEAMEFLVSRGWRLDSLTGREWIKDS